MSTGTADVEDIPTAAAAPNSWRHRVMQRLAALPIGVQALVNWIPGGLFFFRASFTSGFDRVSGDPGDARLVVAVHEHWMNVFRGHASWTSPPFFFPTKGTLGYSDTFFLNQVFYAPLRLARLDEFLAFQWTIVLLSIVGFVGMFVLLRREIGLRAWPTIALASTFTFANNLYVQAPHPQMYSVYWAPWLVLLVLRAWRGTSRREQAAPAAIAGGLLGILLFSDYYIGWFDTFVAGIFVLCFTIQWVRTSSLRALVAAVRRRLVACVAFAIGLAVALVPFFVVYLPTLRTAGGRKYDDVVLNYAPKPREVLNVGENNYLWGSLARHLFDSAQINNGETTSAVTPLLVGLALLAGILAWRVRRRPGAGMLAACCIAGSVTVAVLIVLPIHFRFGSLWRIPWTIVPGTTGIRAVSRIDIQTGLVACLTVAFGVVLATRFVRWRPDRARAGSFALAAVLVLPVVEQINVGDNALIDRSMQMQLLNGTPHLPSGCRSLYITASLIPHWSTELNVTALLLAQHVGIPTLNGYSGQNPPGFAMVDPGTPDYPALVQQWAAAHHIEAGLCSYDFDTSTWAGPG